MQIKKNRVLLCTSPLQVIGARSAMDYSAESGVTYSDYLIIVHPLLKSSSSISIINKLSSELNFKKVFNLIDDLENIQKYTKKSLFESVKGKIVDYESLLLYAKNFFSKEIGTVHCVLFRHAAKDSEHAFIEACGSNTLRYSIEDGVGDHMTAAYKKSMNLNRNIRSFIKFLLCCIIESHCTCKNVFLHKLRSHDEYFSNIPSNNKKSLKLFFLKNIKNVNYERKGVDRKIVILGALFTKLNHKMDEKLEVEKYNKLIEVIVETHQVSPKDIWYKHHPRLNKKSWEFKKNKLNCSIYDYNCDDLFEVEMANANIKAVFSPGSTSLLYAKEVFNIKAYYIDNMYPRGSTGFDYLKYISQKYNIEVVGI